MELIDAIPPHLLESRPQFGRRLNRYGPIGDGEIGHLEDFLFDGETWEIRYAVIDTKNWWPGKKVLLRPQWIKRVSWADH